MVVLEVKTKKGEKYRGATLYALCAGIQTHIREKRSLSADKNQQLDIYKDNSFVYFRNVLDSELKLLHCQGTGLTTKCAEVISIDMENSLWEDGILGGDTPKKLLDTLIYCFGLKIVRTRRMHHQNQKKPSWKMMGHQATNLFKH